MSTGDPIIRCDGLTRRFGSFVAVDGVHFTVARRTVFGLLGPNGAGKSTLIRMLCGVLTPSAGRAWIVGYDVTHEIAHIKGIIGYMSQQFSLYDELSAFENLSFFWAVVWLTGEEAGHSTR